MATPIHWLIYLAVISAMQQVSQCGVIGTQQRDLIWADDKSIEISNVEKRHDKNAKPNVSNDTTKPTSENITLSTNETLPQTNGTQIPAPNLQDIPDGLNLNTTNIDKKVSDTSQVGSERQPRSNGYNKPCRSKLLSYNPLSFTSHEFGKEYNPPPVVKPQPRTKSYPTGKPKPPYHREDKKYSGLPKVQPYQNHHADHGCKSGYNYQNGVCILAKPPQGYKTKSYQGPLPVRGYPPRPQPESYPVYPNEKRGQYQEKPAVFQKPSGAIQRYLPKPQYPVVVANNPYKSQDNKGALPYGQKSPYPKPNPYVKNLAKEYNGNPNQHYPAKNQKYPSNSYQRREGYEKPVYEKPYSSHDRDYVHREEGRTPGYDFEKSYSSEEESSESSYSSRYDQGDRSESDDSYESDDGKSSSERECIPLKQYLAENPEHGHGDSSEEECIPLKEYLAENSEHGDEDSPENESNSLSEEKRYDTKVKSSGKRRKSYHEKPGRSEYKNPYVSFHEDKYPKKPKYEERECKKPKAVNEIILPKGGLILEGEYVLQRKSGETHKHCDNYPRIIDRITIGKGGYIHKGRYTLEKDEHTTGRTKKDVEEGEEIEITVPFELEPDEDEVHISRPREIEEEMFEDEELEEKTIRKRMSPRLPTIVVPIDLNVVDPLLKGVGKVTKDVNKIKLKIKQKEIQRQVNQAVRNIKHLNKDHQEKLERMKTDLKRKLESKSVHKTPLINRDTGNNVKTLSTTFNFNSPAISGALGSPVLRHMRASKPETLLAKPHLHEKYSESDEIVEPYWLKRLSGHKTYEDIEEPIYHRERSHKTEEDHHEPRRLNLLEPVKVKKYRTLPAATCPAEHHNQRSHPHDVKEVTEYEMSLMPLVRRGIHKVKSLVFDVPDGYPSRRLRSPVVYEEPRKVSRAVFNEDGYWFEKDLTELEKVQRPREIIYSDVIYSSDPDHEGYYDDYRRE